MSAPELEHLKLWSLEERRNRADLIEAFKLFKGLTDVPYTTFFQLATDSNTGGLPSLKNEDQQTLLQD